MYLFLKIIVVILVIVLLVLILFPCHEYFQNAQDMLEEKSSVIYSDPKITTDAEYLKKLNPISNDLLIMYRCIEFVKGGIEKVIYQLRKKEEDPFFISKKYETEYTDFSEIEKLIKSSISELHTYYQQKFHGPIYLLITQYPLYNSISADCIITTQSSPLENSFSPIVQTIDDKCKNLTHPHKRIKCEFYILMPAHHQGGKHTDNKLYLVGRRKDAALWEDIVDSMADLLLPGNSYINNVRSKDKQCYTKCGEIQVDGYMCGARNGDKVYKSEVFNTPINNIMEKTHSDYANLYIINTNGINNLLGTTIQGGKNDLIIKETFAGDNDNTTIASGISTQPLVLPEDPKRASEFSKDLSNNNTNEKINIIYQSKFDEDLCITEKKVLESAFKIEKEKLVTDRDKHYKDFLNEQSERQKLKIENDTLKSKCGPKIPSVMSRSFFSGFTRPTPTSKKPPPKPKLISAAAKKKATAKPPPKKKAAIAAAETKEKVARRVMETERTKLYGTCNKEGNLYTGVERRVAELKSKLPSSKKEYDTAVINLGKRYKDMDKKCPKAAARYVDAKKKHVDAEKKLRLLKK